MLRRMATLTAVQAARRRRELHKIARGAFHQREMLDRAEAALRRSLAANSEDVRTLMRLGDICRMLGRLADAGDCYSRVTQLRPGGRKAVWLKSMLSGNASPHAPLPGYWPAPFVRIANFLTPAEHDRVLQLALARRGAFAPGKVGAGSGRRVQPDKRIGLVAGGEACKDIAAWFVPKLRSALPPALTRLRLNPTLPACIDLKMTSIQDGGYSRPHQDPSPRGEHRLRTPLCIYYFHRRPKAYSGGDLLLYDTDVNAGDCDLSAFSRIEPFDNSLVIFPRIWFHEVTPVRSASGEFADGRFGLNCLWPRQQAHGSPNHLPVNGPGDC